MSRIPIVGGLYTAYSKSQNQQRCINWYPEQVPYGRNNNNHVLYPTPGLKPVGSPQAVGENFIFCEGVNRGGFDLSTASYSGDSIVGLFGDTSDPEFWVWANGGQYAFRGSRFNREEFSVAYDLTTRTGDQQSASAENIIKSLSINCDGGKALSFEHEPGDIPAKLKTFTFPEPFDLDSTTNEAGEINTYENTVTLDDSLHPGVPYGHILMPDQITVVVIWRDSNNGIYTLHEYQLNGVFDLSTLTDTGNSVDISSNISNVTRGNCSSDGTKLYICDRGDVVVHQFSVTNTPSVEGLSYDGVVLDVSSEIAIPQSVDFNGPQDQIYVCGHTLDDGEVAMYTGETL